jgi:hypothetical protein
LNDSLKNSSTSDIEELKGAKIRDFVEAFLSV